MSTALPVFFSRGPRGPDFYALLKEFGQAPQSTAATLSGDPVPDPLYRLPNLRPSRKFWGLRDDMKSSAAIAQTATIARTPAPKTNKKAAPKTALGAAGAVVSTIFRMAKRMLVLENSEEVEDSGWGGNRPFASYGGLSGEKPKPA